MEENFDALEVITRTRGKVDLDTTPTGENLFLLWGTLTAVFFLLEFVFWQWLHQLWCLWLWIGAVVIGWPWMIVLIRRDHDRTHRRTHGAKIILDYWIFVGAASFAGGLTFGFAGQFEYLMLPIISLLIGIGAFITGEILRFRPKTSGGLIGAAVGIGSFLLQGSLWPWQMLALALVAVVALVIPGILYKKRFRDGI